MWLFLNNAFLSIVWSDECADDELLVRARRPGDIDRTFPGVKVMTMLTTDYQYRAVIPRADVAGAIAASIVKIDYSNFKSSIEDKPYHDACLKVWSAMSLLQPNPPYGGNFTRGLELPAQSSQKARPSPKQKKAMRKASKLKRGQ